MEARLNWFDRVIMYFAPKWGAQRVRARVLARHFQAAASGYRTSGWHRQNQDANAAASGSTLPTLRAQARDLVRNNPWARRGLRRLVTNTVGWGIKPKATGRGAEAVMKLWKQWGETTQCDAAGRLTFYGLQRLVMRTIVESGEVLIRRRRRRPEDGLAIPLQLQVLEPDYIDASKDGPVVNEEGRTTGNVVQGIEFDLLGRRVAYWLFNQHPGASSITSTMVQSFRVPAENILHVYDQERAGQVHGVPWFASVDVRLHEFAEFEDATLVKQKIASCMAAFVTDDGAGETNLTKDGGTDENAGLPVETLMPGMILNLPPGKKVETANPPQANDHQSFSIMMLRGVAAGLGVTYEDLTGDMTQVNFSSARMGRIAHTADVYDWQWNMLIPQFCAPAWMWMLEAVTLAGLEAELLPADWVPPAMPMIDPDKEGMAMQRRVRAGMMTHNEMIRSQGYDPRDFWKDYAEGLKMLDENGIILDSDPRNTNSSGQRQQLPADGGSSAGSAPTEEDDEDSEDEVEPDDGEELDGSATA